MAKLPRTRPDGTEIQKPGRRQQVLTLRVSDDEREKIMTALHAVNAKRDESNLESMSDYLRGICFPPVAITLDRYEAVKAQHQDYCEYLQFLAVFREIKYELAAQGNNLNQLTKKVNSEDAIDKQYVIDRIKALEKVNEEIGSRIDSIRSNGK